MLYVIAYDIASDKRRKKVLDLLRSYGVPVQLSVVECELESAQLVQLKKRMATLLNSRRDRVSIYRLCLRCSQNVERMGTHLTSVLGKL